VLCNKGTPHLGAHGHQEPLVRQWRGGARGETENLCPPRTIASEVHVDCWKGKGIILLGIF
jgi:hypothetical protein